MSSAPANNSVYEGLKTAVETDNALSGLLKVMDSLMDENTTLRTRLKRRAEQPLRKQVEAEKKLRETMEEQFKFQITSLNEKHISMVSSYAGVVKEQQEKITELEEKLKGLTDTTGSLATNAKVTTIQVKKKKEKKPKTSDDELSEEE